MPANPADISQAIRPARIENWSSDAVKARFPNARDGLASPAEGFFDIAADGATAIAQRAAIFGTERRHFVAEAQDLVWPDPTAGLPLVRLIDPELKVDGNHIPARIELSLEDESTADEVFG